VDTPELADLTARWIEGWVRCRPGSGARRVDGGWEVAVVGSQKRHVETVLVEPDPALLEAYAAPAAAEPGRWVSVLTVAPRTDPVPAGLELLLDREQMMSAPLAVLVAEEAPGTHPRDLLLDASSTRCRLTLLDGDEVAARGTVGLYGTTAVFDQIGTEEAHRRRGHGSRLMAALGAWAVEHGAREGVLVASVEGQALYTRLGWSTAAHLATFRGSGVSAPG